MLKALGDQGKLLPIYEKAKEKAVELDKKNKEKKAVKSWNSATWVRPRRDRGIKCLLFLNFRITIGVGG